MLSVKTSFLPSGENAGEPFIPIRSDIFLRLPVLSVCMKIDDKFPSKETYANCLLSGDQAGDIMGSLDSRIILSLSPSESEITNL